MLKNGFNNFGFIVSFWAAEKCTFPWGLRLGHGGNWIPTFRWNLQGIVGCFKRLQQKMWDLISGGNKYVK